MNKIRYNSLTLTIALLILPGIWACDTLLDDFEYEKKPSKLVVNAILNPDSVISIHISSSKPYNPPGTFKLLENVDVEFFENDQTIGQLSSKGSGYYTLSGTYPQEGATYTVVAKAEGYESVWAETTIPHKIENLEVEDRVQTTTYQDGYSQIRMAYRLTFQVPTGHSAYYATSISSQKSEWVYERTCVERVTPLFNGYYYETDSCNYTIVDTLAIRTEQIYMYTNSSLVKFSKDWENYYIAYFDGDYSTKKMYFSNQNFSGNSMSLDLRIDYYNLFNNVDNEITIWIDSFDKVLYNFMYSLAKKHEVDDDPFAEKVSVYSNVNGGLGIFGSCNSTGHFIRYDDEFIDSITPKY